MKLKHTPVIVTLINEPNGYTYLGRYEGIIDNKFVYLKGVVSNYGYREAILFPLERIADLTTMEEKEYSERVKEYKE